MVLLYQTHLLKKILRFYERACLIGMRHEFIIALLFFVTLHTGAALEDTRKPRELSMALLFVSDGEEGGKHLFLINGTVAFKTVKGLKNHLSGQPWGSRLSWAPGCLRYGNEPLLNSEAEMKNFKEFCKSIGIHFVLIPSG